MSHSHQGHREHGKSRQRASHLMKSGGHAHSDAAADKKLIAAALRQHEKKEHGVHGHKRGGRLNKYARGGAAKKHHTQVNIAVVAPHGKDQGAAGAAPGVPAVPPHPPMQGGPPMGPAPVLPPGAGGPPGPIPAGAVPPPRPPMKRGGRVSEMKPVPFATFKPRAGADSGEGRLALEKHQGKLRGRNKKK